MKIRLLCDGGYEGLANVQFPVEVEVEREGYNGGVYVGWDAISAIPGWFHDKNDAYGGESYYFCKHEVVVITPDADAPVEEKKSLTDLFGENGHEAAGRISALRETGVSVSDTFVQNVADAARKDKLISLVRDYGEIIAEGYKQDSLLAMLACHEEGKRLLKEIIKMINEGV